MLLVAALGVVGVSPAQLAQPLYTITISTPESVIKVGSEVRLDVTTKNVSNQTIYMFFSTAPGRDPEIHLRDSKGNPVLETPYGQKVHGTDPNRRPFSGSVFGYQETLKPGETFEEKLNLSEEYDLSKPGEYTIQVRRHDVLSEDDLKSKSRTVAFVKSNTITITITP
jgi:hypothetical protein